MKKAEKFYKWLLRCKSVHLADNEAMVKAFERVETGNNREVLTGRNPKIKTIKL